MSGSPVLSEVLEAALNALLSGDVERWLHVCTTDVVFEFPFAPEGRPGRLTGRADVGAYLERVVSAASDRTIRSALVHPMAQENVVVLELTVRGTSARQSGTPVVRDTSSIAVVTFREGRIARYRDYWNPLGGRVVETGEAA